MKLKSFSPELINLPSAQQIEEFIEKHPGFRREEMSQTESVLRAFAINPHSGRYVTSFEGGFVIMTRTMARNYDYALIRKLQDEYIAEAKAKGIDISEEQSAKYFDEAIAAVAPYTSISTSIGTLVYHIDSKMLFVSATGGAVGLRNAHSTLLSIFDGLTYQKINNKEQRKTLANRLLSHIEGRENAFGDLSLGGDLAVKTPGENGVQMTIKGSPYPCGRDPHGIAVLLKNGGNVERIKLHNDSLSFDLKAGFNFSAVKELVSDDEGSTVEETVEVDETAQYMLKLATSMMLIQQATSQVASLLNIGIDASDLPVAEFKKPKADDKEAAE